MIQKVSHYIALGKVSSRTTFARSKKQFFKYFIFNISAMIGKLCFLSFPLFAFAEYHLVKQVEQAQKLTFGKAFEDASSKKVFETTQHLALLNHVLTIAGLLVIGGLAYGLIYLGTTIDNYFDLNRYYVEFIFQAMSGTILVVFLLFKNIYMESLTYILRVDHEISLAEAFRKNEEVMANKNKVYLFYIKAYFFGVFAIYAIIAGVSSYLAFVYFIEYWFIIITILLILFGLRVMTKLMFGYKVASTKLFEDLHKDLNFEQAVTEGEEKLSEDKMLTSEILLTLFDTFTDRDAMVESKIELEDETGNDEEDEVEEVEEDEIEEELDELVETEDLDETEDK